MKVFLIYPYLAYNSILWMPLGLPFVAAHLRRDGHTVSIFDRYAAKSRVGRSRQRVDHAMLEQVQAFQPDLVGLQGPTIAPVYLRDSNARDWYAISIIVRKQRLVQAVEQLRAIGGSGVVVTPATYVFEDEPVTYRQLLAELGRGHPRARGVHRL